MAKSMELYRRGELEARVREAVSRLERCALCPRRCGVNRLEGELGACGVGRLARVSSYSAHFGEEAPLVGERGSGTIFFAGCNLHCVFCQNYGISHEVEGSQEVAPNQLAWIMLQLQEQGCHNVNFVTPSHVVPQILEALALALDGGLDIPLVFNCGGYDLVETFELLDGVVDIYMPDVKFAEPESGERYCGAPDYPEVARAAVKEMYRQVGDLRLDSRGLARVGLLVRHLVMPGGLDETRQWMEFLAREISPHTYVNLMDQYHPSGRAGEFQEIDRRLDPTEFLEAQNAAEAAGLSRLDDRYEQQAFRLLQAMLRDRT